MEEPVSYPVLNEEAEEGLQALVLVGVHLEGTFSIEHSTCSRVIAAASVGIPLSIRKP